jgi:hypothetical protein
MLLGGGNPKTGSLIAGNPAGGRHRPKMGNKIAHVVILTEKTRPQPIFVAAFTGVERLLRIDFDVAAGRASYINQRSTEFASNRRNSKLASGPMPSIVTIYAESRCYVRRGFTTGPLNALCISAWWLQALVGLHLSPLDKCDSRVAETFWWNVNHATTVRR